MTKFLIVGLLTLISASAWSDTIPGAESVLQFSKHADSFASKVGSRYIKFVPEDVTFPDGPQKAKFERALEIMEEVINSEEFKIKVIGYERNGNRSYQKNYLWNDSQRRLSNEDIYEIIMNGDEKMRPGTPGEMNFNSWVRVCNRLQMATIWCRQVIGSTTPDTDHMIKLNWTFYRNFETHQMVSNMVHEWIHLLGFLHGNDRITEEVPYVVGGIAGAVAKRMEIQSRRPADNSLSN